MTCSVPGLENRALRLLQIAASGLLPLLRSAQTPLPRECWSDNVRAAAVRRGRALMSTLYIGAWQGRASVHLLNPVTGSTVRGPGGDR